jgi:hypothetical protein
MIRAAERWRAIKITQFERRQMTALKKELNQEYEADIGLDAKTSKMTLVREFPALLGLDRRCRRAVAWACAFGAEQEILWCVSGRFRRRRGRTIRAVWSRIFITLKKIS